jgi:hypothetical protein
MSINGLLDMIAADSRCKVHPPSAGPAVPAGLLLPVDLQQFYRCAGGLDLFSTQPFGFTIVGPNEFTPSNPVLLGDFYLRNKKAYDEDRSAFWYLIARGTKTNEFITIDLDKSRLGRCYDSFWEVYAKPDSKVVARSFTELVERLYAAKGNDLYWAGAEFDLGKAYDR